MIPGNSDRGQPETARLRQVWLDSGDLFAEQQTELDQFRLDQLMASVFCSGPYYYYVFDLADLSMLMVSDRVEEIHGLDPKSLTLQQVLSQIHPDDMDFVARAEETAIRTVKNVVGFDKVKKYKASYCFRMRTAGGEYRLFNHQSFVLTTDERGRVGKSLNIHTDISHLASTNNHKLSLIGMEGERSLLNIDVDLPTPTGPANPCGFSEREITIIRLIATGMTSAQIARELTLSEFTIKNHRKRILKKADCQNMSQLLGSSLADSLI